jgi:hypothetical protein
LFLSSYSNSSRQTCFTNLQWKNKCPQSSVYLLHITHLVVNLIPFLSRFLRIVRLLCVNLHKNCFSLPGHSRFHSCFPLVSFQHVVVY